MQKINIEFKIKNSKLPYQYSGEAVLNKDILEFNDNDENYLYDMKINRLTKTKNGYRIVIDFEKEMIQVYEKDTSLDIKIKIKSKKISSNYIKIIYSIDKEEIEFELEVK